MKSKLLLVLAASFLLVGCNEAEVPAEEVSNSEESQVSESVDSISDSEKSTSSEESSSEETSSEESSEESVSLDGAEHVFKAQFYVLNDNSVPTSDSDNPEYTSTVQEYFLDGNTQLLTSASAVNGYSQINFIGNKNDSDRFSTMILGSSSRDGSLKLNFAYTITKVTVEAQGYCKHIAYNDTWSIDSDCVLDLEGKESLELPTVNDAAAEIKAKDYTFSSGTTTLNFSTGGTGRVFLHSLEITYLVA